MRGGVERILDITEHCDSTAKCCLLQIAVLTFLYVDVMQQGRDADCTLGVAGKRSVETSDKGAKKVYCPTERALTLLNMQHASS